MSSMKSEIVVVTGAAGLLGGAVVRRLAGAAEVHAIVRRQPQDPAPGVHYHPLDLAQPWSSDGLPQRVDTVMHLAQSPHFRDFPEKALDVFRVNVNATARLLDYAWRAGARRFVYASSGGVYGAGSRAFVESDALAAPASLGYYLGTKLSGEALAMSYAAQMQVKVLRFFFIYGPGQNRTMLLPRLVDNVVAGRALGVQGGEGLRLNPVHVADASVAVERCLTHEGTATFNVGGSEIVSLRELGLKIGRVTGRQPVFEDQTGTPRHTIGDISAMRRELCEPSIALDTGLADLLV